MRVFNRDTHKTMNPESQNLDTQILRVLVFTSYADHTVPYLMERFGQKRNVINRSLQRLRAAGFIEWGSGRRGIIKPLVKEVPYG